MGTWGSALTCISGGGGIGADWNGYPQNGFRYDSPTFGGFSVSGGFYEDDSKDIAFKYAGEFGNFKVAAAGGYTNLTDEGHLGWDGTGAGDSAPGAPALPGGGGFPFQGYRKDVDIWQVGASAMHVPSGLFIYGMWQQEDNKGTEFGQRPLPTCPGSWQ